MVRTVVLSSLLVWFTFKFACTTAANTTRPNVVFIFTDDQDARLNSLDYMPNVQKLLVDQGTHFKSHYCTVALCCPSRVSLWTGKAAHNTNVTNVSPPYGGYPKFIQQGFNDNWVPLWLQQAGYQTYYTGKLMNAQSTTSYNTPFVNGFTGSDFLIDPGTYRYKSPIFQRNHDAPVYYNNTYSTDLVHKKGLDFLSDAVKNKSSPFFLTIAPIAPHSNFQFSGNSVDISPPVPADRYKDYFPNATVPRTPNFNPETPSSVDWIATLPRLSAQNITYNDAMYRDRLRALQSVDEIVADVVEKLEAYGILDNTYIFYSSDNGYHIGQHRLAPGKGCGIEEDINVPLVVRGPGVPAGKVVTRSTSHTDLAPTWWKILGIPLRDDFDGNAFPLTASGIAELESSKKAKEHVQVEFWDNSDPQEYNSLGTVNNTYKGLRIVGEQYGYYYAVWCSNNHELYDMKVDPDQLHNLYRSASNATNSTSSIYPASTSPTFSSGSTASSLKSLIDRLDALLLTLKTCKGTKACTEPWSTLLPGKNVYNLQDALNPKYDEYFAGLPRVAWEKCDAGYIKEVEAPFWEDGLQYKGEQDVNKMARKGRHSLNRP